MASGQQLLDDLSMNIGQTEVTSLGLVCQALVVDTQDVHQRRIHVVDVDAVLDDCVAEIVGLAM